MSTPLAGPPPQAAPTAHRGRRLDLMVGILVGLVLGVAVVAAFVFLGSEGTIDAPRISGVDSGKPSQENGPARESEKSGQGTGQVAGETKHTKQSGAKAPAGNAAELGTEP